MRAKVIHIYHPKGRKKKEVSPADANVYDVLIHEYEDGSLQLFVKHPGELLSINVATRNACNVERPLCWTIH